MNGLKYVIVVIFALERRHTYSLPSVDYLLDHCTKVFGIADLTRLQLPKCNNHLVSFIKVDGLFVPYIVHIFDTIKSITMVYRSMDCPHFGHH